MPGTHAAQTVVRFTRSDVLSSGASWPWAGGDQATPQLRTRAPIQAQATFNAIRVC